MLKQRVQLTLLGLISIAVVTGFLLAGFLASPLKAEAQTTTCRVYTRTEPSTECDSLRNANPPVCTRKPDNSTQCYDPELFDCTYASGPASRFPDGIRPITCNLKAGTSMPPACSNQLTVNCTLGPVSATNPDRPQLGSIEGDADKAFGGCSETTGTGTPEDACGFIDKYINPFIKFLSALVGMVVTIMLIWAGIQYSAAAGDPAKVTAAKGKIMNAVIALLAYLFLFAGLQWLVPGGIL